MELDGYLWMGSFACLDLHCQCYFFLLFEISERMFHRYCWTIGTESATSDTHRRRNLIYNS
jgi:hypothetical protein